MRGRGGGPTGWDGAAGEIHRRNFSDLLSSHLLHWRERGRAPLFLCGTLLREVRRLVHSYGE